MRLVVAIVVPIALYMFAFCFIVPPAQAAAMSSSWNAAWVMPV